MSTETPRDAADVTHALASRFTYLRVLMRTRFAPTPAIRSFEQDISRLWQPANQAAGICLVVGDDHVATRDRDARNGKRCACPDAIELRAA
jgi:hypothetical protein